jgi:hypothetical protein
MGDLLLQYRACGAECRDDYLRSVANENGLPFPCVRRLAGQLGEHEDLGMLLRICEERWRFARQTPRRRLAVSPTLF